MSNSKSNNRYNNNSNNSSGGKGGRPSSNRDSNNGRNNNYRSNRTNTNNNKTKFKGSCEEMNGMIYANTGPGQGDAFLKTTEQLCHVVSGKWSNGADVKLSIENFQKIQYALPGAPAKIKNANGTDSDEVDPVQQSLFNERIKRYVRKEEDLNQHLQQTYPIVWGQCTTTLQNKLRTIKDYQRVHNEQDTIELLKAIRDTSFHVEANKYKYEGFRLAEHNLLTCKQSEDESVSDYCKRFRTRVDVREQFGSIGLNEGLLHLNENYLKLTDDAARDKIRTTIADEMRNEYLAYLMIVQADKKRFGKLLEELNNAFIADRKEYPKTMEAAEHRLLHYRDFSNIRIRQQISKNNTQGAGMAHQQEGTRSGGKTACYICGGPHTVKDHQGFVEPEDWWANQPENKEKAKQAGYDFEKAKKALKKKKSKGDNNANVGEQQQQSNNSNNNDNDTNNNKDNDDEEGSQHFTMGEEELNFSFHQMATMTPRRN